LHPPALLHALIHRTSWNKNSANFVMTEFSEVRVSRRARIRLPDRILHDRSLEVRPFEVGSAQVGAGEVRTRQVGPVEACAR
jgi:hypothetical protein